MALLADDPLGATREQVGGGLDPEYDRAFRTLSEHPDHEVVVARVAGTVVGVLQLSFLPHLTYRGGWRGQIEGVRVAASVRGMGVGRRLVEEAVRRARLRGCHLVQLTTDRRRDDALRFYERLGFVASHHGMKLHLAPE